MCSTTLYSRKWQPVFKRHPWEFLLRYVSLYTNYTHYINWLKSALNNIWLVTTLNDVMFIIFLHLASSHNSKTNHHGNSCPAVISIVMVSNVIIKHQQANILAIQMVQSLNTLCDTRGKICEVISVWETVEIMEHYVVSSTSSRLWMWMSERFIIKEISRNIEWSEQLYFPLW